MANRWGLTSLVLLLGQSAFAGGTAEVGPTARSVPNTRPAPSGLAPGVARTIAVRWRNDIALFPDPVQSEELTPILVGRVYLLDENRMPVEGDGSLRVELADAARKRPATLEVWTLDPGATRKLLHTDRTGRSYHLCLPWTTCRQDLRQVQMTVVYQSRQGAVLRADPQTIVLSQFSAPRQRREIERVEGGPAEPQRGKPSRKRFLECSFLIPLARDRNRSDGKLHREEEWAWLEQKLESFGGATRGPEYEGWYRDPNTGEKVRDRSRRYMVALPRAQVGTLRQLLREACGRFGQKCIYLSVAGRVEFVELPAP